MQITIENETFNLMSYDCSLLFVETGDRTQTLNGVDHIERGKVKRHIKAFTSDLYPEQASILYGLLKNRIVTVTYIDTPTNTEQTRIFIMQEDLLASKKMWKNINKFYSGMSLDLLEKGAE